MIASISTSPTLTVILRQNMLAIQNFLSKIELPQFFLSSKNIVFFGLVLALTACKSVQTTTNSTTNHATAQLQRDSIYLHDSIFVRIRADTVYLEKWHTRWREKEITRTDTVQINTIQVQTKEVRYVPRFYKYCAALTALLLILLLLRVTLYLYRRFH